MAITNNPKLTPLARNLRKNMTKEEKKLWYQFLCKIKPQFHRQFVISQYIVDFYCAEANLIVELDGAQHYEGDAPSYDAARDEYLQSLGNTVLRYTNLEVNRNFRGVCEDIWQYIHKNLSANPLLGEGD